MEEKETKTMSINDAKGNTQKMSYEQLEQVAHQLSEQARKMYDQLQKANLANMFKRMDYLFKVIESSHMFNSDFVERCTKEIEDFMTVPEESEETTEEDNKE